MRISDWSSDVCSSDLVAKVDELLSLCDSMEEQVRERERLNAELMASLVHALTEPDPDGGGAVVPTSFTDDSPTYTTPEAGNGHAGTTPETKSVDRKSTRLNSSH